MKSIEACEGGWWTIATWKRGDGSNPALRPFRCRSWRHEGECRAYCGACDFARCADALTRFPNWTYLILTYPHRQWPDVKALFRAGVVHWARLRKRIQREYGDMKYIQTWEIHRSGYPHVNVVVSNENLFKEVARNHRRVREDFLDPACAEVGFGFCKWAETLRDERRMAGYIAKLGLELTGHGVKSQTPVNAPRHFRRIRASRHTLPPRKKSDCITGQLLKMNYANANECLYGDNLDADPC